MGSVTRPVADLSGYLTHHQRDYYRLLSAVRTDGDWEAWIAFFLEAVQAAAAEAERAIVAVASVVATDRRRLLAAPRVGAVSRAIGRTARATSR